MSKPENNVMFVERLLPAAHPKLATIVINAPLTDATKVLRAGTDLVIVCDSTGILAGVITKTDVVDQMSSCGGSNCRSAASLAMRATSCHVSPVVDMDFRLLGVVYPCDILKVPLEESTEEETILRDYVMGVGYLN